MSHPIVIDLYKVEDESRSFFWVGFFGLFYTHAKISFFSTAIEVNFTGASLCTGPYVVRYCFTSFNNLYIIYIFLYKIEITTDIDYERLPVSLVQYLGCHTRYF